MKLFTTKITTSFFLEIKKIITSIITGVNKDVEPILIRVQDNQPKFRRN